MKKTYISPAAQSLEFAPEAMLAASVKIINNVEEDVTVGQSFSGQKIWGSSSVWENE